MSEDDDLRCETVESSGGKLSMDKDFLVINGEKIFFN